MDKVILARPHSIGEYRVDVKKAVPKDQRQMQAQQYHLQQQQQQYALQMQAAAYHYCYNNLPYTFLNNGTTCTLPISAPLSLMTHNGHPGAGGYDESMPRFRPSNNNHVSNSLRYIPPGNNRRQSSRGSQ